jgi:flavin reductase (DIM6/NTAB) family NADH-FMN oxidoreductase RutF
MNHTPVHQRLRPEPTVLRHTFAGFPSGVAAIAAVVQGKKQVLVASSFTVGVSLEPPLVMFAVQNSSRTWKALRATGAFGVSVFGEAHAELCRKLSSGPPEDRFDGVDHHVASNGAIYLYGAPVWLDCEVWKSVPAGDHHVVILEIQGLFFDPGIEPLVWHRSRFRKLDPLTEQQG